MHGHRFAELMMDTLARAMKGQTMESVGEGMGAGLSAPHPFAAAEIDSSAPNAITEAEAYPETPGESTKD